MRTIHLTVSFSAKQDMLKCTAIEISSDHSTPLLQSMTASGVSFTSNVSNRLHHASCFKHPRMILSTTIRFELLRIQKK